MSQEYDDIDIEEIKNKIDNGTNNCDTNNKYYVSEIEMSALINSMVLYEGADDIKTKPFFKHDLIAENNERIIIQQKFPSVKEECSICLNPLFHKQVAYLPCKHYFHSSCLTTAFNSRLYTCPLCRNDLNNVLKKIGFKFPLAQPEQITDLDLDLIYRLLESSLYNPNAVGNANANAVANANANTVGDYLLLYSFEFNLDDIEQMMSNYDSYSNYSDDEDGNVDVEDGNVEGGNVDDDGGNVDDGNVDDVNVDDDE